MELSTTLAQSAWRLRAYFGAPTTDDRLVGWRRDTLGCPVAEWLLFELQREEALLINTVSISVDTDFIIVDHEIALTPLDVSLFIDLLDRQEAHLFGEAERVGHEEACVALIQAEHQAAQLLLPPYAESLAYCDYLVEGEKCHKAACTPTVYGFLDVCPRQRAERGECDLFIGRLCAEHVGQIIVPPRNWWPDSRREEEKTLECAGAER